MTSDPLLARPSESDHANLVRLFTDAGVRRYLGGPLSEDAAVQRASFLIDRPPDHVWGIRPAAGQDAVGIVWLTPHHEGGIELSFVLLPEWQGRGLAFRACSEALCLGFGELGLARIVSETQAANTKSIALLRRLGMRVERSLQRFGAEQLLFVLDREAG
jgi:[ribosomal protein S5]-alanine N-acetyltransferase